MKNWDHSIHQHVLVYQGKDRIILLYFCRSNKKVYGFCFLGGHPVEPELCFMKIKTVTIYMCVYVSVSTFFFSLQSSQNNAYPVDLGCTIHRQHLCRGVNPPHSNECPGYDTKQSDGDVPVILGLWRMWSTSSLSLLSDPLWPGMVAPDRVLSMG